MQTPFMDTQCGTFRSLSIFKNLGEEEIELVRDLVQTREYKSNELILKEGEPVHSLYVICDGSVHVKRKARDHELLLGRLEKGDFFGEVNLFDQGGATASVTAVQPTRAALVHFKDLRPFMSSNPSIGYKILEAITTELGHRLRETDRRLVLSLYWKDLKAEDTRLPG